VNTLAAGIGYVDLLFQGRANVIATALLHGPGGVTIVDPGPSSCNEALTGHLERQGARTTDIEAIVLTHIHLDHAGATGLLVRQNPRVMVYVHEIGAKHMIDPTKLLDSASRLYGSEMDRLWGAVLPVPEERIQRLAGGERIRVSGHDLSVAHTPGHASHHVSYLEGASGIAFVGDTAGIQIGAGSFVLPPTPPPDIDLDLWRGSLAVIEAWHPSTLFLTHFGPSASVSPHLRELEEQLVAVADMVRRSLAVEGTDDDRFASFAKEFGVHLRRNLGEERAATYEKAAPFRFNWQGLARYWRKSKS
jgi:glyoxylase-like metal-dependent hydrolase (beta-lactamase superfamily II)